MAVTIQQAGAGRFARWLEQKLTGIKVIDRWPATGFDLKTPSISVVCAGPRQDQTIEHRSIKLTSVSDTQLDALIQVKACIQPLQLDVWTKSWKERDSICAQLDDLFVYGDADAGGDNPAPTGNSVLLKLENGWEPTDTFADFQFENPELEDAGKDLQRAQYRAVFRGEARFMLTVKRRVAKQKLLKFSLLLRESDEAAERDLYTVFGA